MLPRLPRLRSDGMPRRRRWWQSSSEKTHRLGHGLDGRLRAGCVLGEHEQLQKIGRKHALLRAHVRAEYLFVASVATYVRRVTLTPRIKL